MSLLWEKRSNICDDVEQGQTTTKGICVITCLLRGANESVYILYIV